MEQPQHQPQSVKQLTYQPQPERQPQPVAQSTPEIAQPTATATIDYGYPSVGYPGVELIDDLEVEDLKVNDIPNNVASKREIDELLAFLEDY